MKNQIIKRLKISKINFCILNALSYKKTKEKKFTMVLKRESAIPLIAW